MSMEEIMMGDVVVVTDVPEILTIPQEELEAWEPAEKHKKYYNLSWKAKIWWSTLCQIVRGSQ